ncbi:MAG: LTA synthase family protein [Anaerorhabdus sp.]|uniref:LTA synthase family protein n=1 Tax=Anaerorhabdus sp. TaxID=1872524 RepID=UPI002FC8C523
MIKNILKHLRNNLDIIFVFLSIIFIELFMRYYLGLDTIATRPLLFSIWFAGLLSSLMFCMGKKTRIIYGGFIVLFFGVLALAQSLHYHFFSTFFSAAKISILKEALTVKGEAVSKFDIKLLVFILPFIGYIITQFLKTKENTYTKKIRFGLSGILSLFFIINIIILTTTYPVKNIKTESDAYLFNTLYNKVKSVERLGFYPYTFKDLYMVLFEGGSNVEKQIEDINSYLANNGYTHEPNEFTGMFEGKNLILILCESLTDVAIQEELTPTLYKMKTEGITFNNHYAPVYQSATADSELVSLTSLFPSINYGPTAYAFYNNTFSNTLASELNDRGYNSNSFHSFYGDFYNRKTLHKNLGFDYFFAQEDLYFEQRDDWQDAYNWNLDKDLTAQTMAKTFDMNEYPFFDFILTVSGHIPYNPYRYEMEGDLWGTMQILGEENNPYSIEALCYFAGQHALDQGIETLITSLEENGQLENTVIAIYGDHYPYGMSTNAKNELYDYNYDYEMNKVPFIIWTPNMEAKQIDNVSSTLDIYPTLANLFNINLNGQYIAGRDALSNIPGTVIWDNYSWLTDKAYYDSTRQKITKFDTISDSEIEKINQDIIDKIDIGQSILITDYYKQGQE